MARDDINGSDGATFNLADFLAADVDLKAVWERRVVAALLGRALALLPPDTRHLLVERIADPPSHGRLGVRPLPRRRDAERGVAILAGHLALAFLPSSAGPADANEERAAQAPRAR